MSVIPKDKEVLQKLAQESPQGFVWAKSFIDAQAKKPGLGLEDFLKEKNIPYVEYIRETQKSGRSPGDVLQAMRNESSLATDMASKMRVADRVPTMPKATTPGEKAVTDLAAKDPKSFALAKAYIDEVKAKPTTELQAFLAKHGVKVEGFMETVKVVTGASSGELLKTMGKAGELVEGAAKVVSHSKFGRVVTAGAALLGALAEANASTIPQASKSFAIAAAGALDPTAALGGPSIAEHAVSKALDPKRQTDFDKAGIDTSKIGVQKNAIAVTEFNSRITREQKFIMGENHPAQLGSLKFKDANGQAVDVEKTLKDPARRGIVLAEIDRREATAGSADMKQLYADMKESALTMAAMEDRRKPLPEGLKTAASPQPVMQQVAALSG